MHNLNLMTAKFNVQSQIKIYTRERKKPVTGIIRITKFDYRL